MSSLNTERWYYEQIIQGYNYRMTDIQAVLGLNQLKRIDEFVVKRRKIANWYKESLNLNKVMPLMECDNANSSWHLFIVRVLGGKSKRNKLAESLLNSGIEVTLHYIPVYRQPHHQSDIKLTNSEKYYDSALSIPIFPSIKKESLEYISEKINLLTA